MCDRQNISLHGHEDDSNRVVTFDFVVPMVIVWHIMGVIHPFCICKAFSLDADSAIEKITLLFVMLKHIHAKFDTKFPYWIHPLCVQSQFLFSQDNWKCRKNTGLCFKENPPSTLSSHWPNYLSEYFYNTFQNISMTYLFKWRMLLCIHLNLLVVLKPR